MMVIEELNLSIAWARAYEAVRRNPAAPLVVRITGLENGPPQEDCEIRAALDNALEKQDLVSIHSTANTIFPSSLWNRDKPREAFFTRFAKVWPHIACCPKNRYGHYFRRMTAFGEKAARPVNQLEHIIQTWDRPKPNHRKSALQAGILDPLIDHTNQRTRGFPCLQQVAFVPIAAGGRDGLIVTGFYPQQYIFDRAYGNYLGLCRLGAFMAHEMGLQLKHMICVIAFASVGSNRRQPTLDGLLKQKLADGRND